MLLEEYSRLTLDELLDVAAHIDRERYPERAVGVDAAIAHRRAHGEVPLCVFLGGGRIGATAINSAWPMVRLSFDREYLKLRTTYFGFFDRKIALSRCDVLSIRERNGWFVRHFQIVHSRTESPIA